MEIKELGNLAEVGSSQLALPSLDRQFQLGGYELSYEFKRLQRSHARATDLGSRKTTPRIEGIASITSLRLKGPGSLPGAVGIEGDLRDLAIVCPAGCDALNSCGTSSFEENHIGRLAGTLPSVAQMRV